MELIKNKQRKFGASKEYIFAKIGGYDALLTPAAAGEAIKRAQQQPEDLPNFWQRLRMLLFK